MRVDRKQARQLAKMAALLSQVGVTVDVEKIQETAKAHTVSDSSKLESVLTSIRRPGDFTYRKCKRCNEPFGSNYLAVAYCSDICRIRDFEELTGCKWSAKPAEERWGGEPPLIIPPDVVRRMLQYAKTLVEYAETQGWASVEDVPEPVFLEPTSTQPDQPTVNLHHSTDRELAISLEQPAKTIEFELKLPDYLGDGY